MNSTKLSALTAALFAVLVAPSLSIGQSPKGQGNDPPKPKKAPDEFKALLDAIEEAYKAPREVDKDVLDELRKQYKNPTPEREQKILREVRRLYMTTPQSEEAILKEVRRAVEQQTADQEERLFAEVRRGGQLPLGAVSAQAQTDYTARLFTRLDLDANGKITEDEMTDVLRLQRGKFDRNLDGGITLEEYTPYYQASLKLVSEKVKTGEIYLKAAEQVLPPKGTSTPARVDDARPAVARSGNLPDGLPKWFRDYDRDADGQVGLYEWVKAGKPIEEFQGMDKNADGLLEAAELLRYLADQKARTANP